MDSVNWTVDEVSAQLEEIVSCAAPPFEEKRRSDLVLHILQGMGLTPWQDELGNVSIAFGPPGRPLVLAAHLDTVFTNQDIRVERHGALFKAPGAGDDGAGLVILLELARRFAAGSMVPRRPLTLLFDVGEEGMGDLRGIRAYLNSADPQPDSLVSLDGTLGEIVHKGMAVRRIRVTFTRPGGHSWKDRGGPSAIHDLVQVAARILALPRPGQPEVSLSIGLVEGGTSINALAPSASMTLDLRSVEGPAVAAFEEAIRAELVPVGSAASVEVVGERASGAIDEAHPLVLGAKAAFHATGIQPVVAGASSTDANLPLSRGIPAIAFGVCEMTGAHTLSEEVDLESILSGMKATLGLLSELGAAD